MKLYEELPKLSRKKWHIF